MRDEKSSDRQESMQDTNIFEGQNKDNDHLGNKQRLSKKYPEPQRLCDVLDNMPIMEQLKKWRVDHER